MRRFAVPLGILLCLTSSVGLASAAPPLKATAGANGIGDPYFPLDGNGGYDVQHYDLDLAYEPETDVLTGTATITAIATQFLSRFNLDFDGLTVRSITVNGEAAKWHRSRGELVITPSADLPDGESFTAVINYDGIPGPIPGDEFGGWIPTDDGVVVAGEPHGAATWFPANDHPIDKASFTFHLDVPEGLQGVANGRLLGSETAGGRTVWTWDAVEPMAPYLATVNVGEFDLDAYSADGIDFWDAIDPDLFDPQAAPHSGSQFAISQVADLSYKRLMHTISVPADGAQLSFWIDRSTEFMWDFVFVEIHTVGQDDWTTLQDLNGHTSQDTGNVCPFWLDIHPFLTHYQTGSRRGCDPSGTSGDWWAATGDSGDAEQWAFDLGAYAGSNVEVSISYASDDIVQAAGVFIDDIVVSTGEGSTSFEADGDEMDGWTVPGAPAGSPGNENDWIVGTAADVPPPAGVIAQGSFARQPEIISFLGDAFGPYPFETGGGIVDDVQGLGFALETQTRPIYALDFFTDPFSGDAVVVHEIAHQWYGDSLAVARWQHIWLNEGFATYAEWLWSEDQGLGTAQEIFDFWYEVIPPEDPFWGVVIGDPGPEQLFDFSVYIRGGMTLHTLRLAVGDEDFFDILETWATDNAGGNVTTEEFIALAESISGQDLDALFDAWLFTAGKPDVAAAAAAAAAGRVDAPRDVRHAPRVVRSQVERYGSDSSLALPR
jgi:Peptidase family M1 domain/Peptidase M1 N-terminal domain